MRLFVVLFLVVTVATGAKRRGTERPRPKSEDKNRNQGQFESFLMNEDTVGLGYSNPVPFGHIFREGYEDPRSNIKSPIDLLELDTVYLKDGPFVRDFIKNRPNKYQVIQYDRPSKISSSRRDFAQDNPRDFSRDLPRDFPREFRDLHDGDTNIQVGQEASAIKNKNDDIRAFWNLEGILTRNLEEPAKYRIAGGRRPKGRQPDDGPNFQRKTDFFSNKTFDLISEMIKPSIDPNFTTCDEFGKRAKFHPNDIVNVNWVPFYIWSSKPEGTLGVARVHRFYYPTKKLVKNFQKDYGPYLSKKVDWEQPKLLMNGSTELLLIAVDRTGLFDAVPFPNLPTNMINDPEYMKNIQIPSSPIRLKIVDPYVSMMYCDHQYAVILAISGTEPDNPRRCISEAATLNMVGNGFPVARDLRMEAMEARMKLADTLQREQNKFITV